MTQDYAAGDAPLRQSLADTFSGLLAGLPHERVTVAALLEGLQGRAYPLIIAIFNLPNVVPTGIPWLSTITGVPMLILMVQMLMRRPTPALPARFSARSMPRAKLQAFLARIDPKLRRLEAMVRPRRQTWIDGRAEVWVLGALLANVILLALPIIFDNLLPAWAILFFCLALLERDGVMAMLGWAMTVATAIWTVVLFIFYAEVVRMARTAFDMLLGML